MALPKSVCDDCVNTQCIWRAPTNGNYPPVLICPHKVEKPKTNADRIRDMDIDHLIEWYCRGRPCGACPYNGVECGIRDWLKQEANE